MNTIKKLLPILYSISCLFLGFACKEKAVKTELSILDLEKTLQSPQQISLDSISKSIHYIPLETNEECLIKYIWQIVVSKDLIVVIHDSQCSLFSSGGRFLRNIGSRGGGPDEYNSITRVFLNNENVVIVDSSKNRVFYYNRNGEFIRSQKIGVPRFDDFCMINEDLHIVYNDNLTGSEKIRFYFLDKSLSIIDSVPYTQQYESAKGMTVRFYVKNVFNKYADYVHCKEMLNDTIFAIDSNRELTPVTVLQLGKFSPDIRERYNITNPAQKVFSGKIMPVLLFPESMRYAFFGGMGMTDQKILIWDKKTGKLHYGTLLYEEKEQKMFGKEIFTPQFISEDQKMLISYELPADIENDDNPTLVLVTLKE